MLLLIPQHRPESNISFREDKFIYNFESEVLIHQVILLGIRFQVAGKFD